MGSEIIQTINDYGFVGFLVALLASALTMVGQAVIKHYRTRDDEDYKHILNEKIEALRSDHALKQVETQSKFDSEIEKVRHEAQVNLFKSNSAFEKQMEVVENMYSKLIDLLGALEDATSSVRIVREDESPEVRDRADRERLRKCISTHETFNHYFVRNLIWLPEEISDQLEILRKSSRTILLDLNFNEQWKRTIQQAAWDKFENAQSEYQEKCIPALEMLMKLFRSHFLPVQSINSKDLSEVAGKAVDDAK